jgi:predicted ATPase
VLDNFEHLMTAAIELSALLAACGNLRLLVTSRELLRLQGEVEFPVPPLAPADAEELFCSRSRLPRDDEIADLCRHLDDLPLAVELAAARTAVLTPTQISERLARRLDLFRGGRDSDPRQQTLRATIEWSYELLTDSEKELFARLAVFSGGCTVDAAEEVAGADVDGLQSLVDKSLVRHTGERFWMLETIGELARERLGASGRADELRRHHADFFLALAEQALPGLKAGEQPIWLRRLEDDHDNLRAALEWLFEHEPERALHLSGTLWLFWYMHGHVSEARRWLERALAAAPTVASEARATALDGAGYLAAEQYDRSGIALIEESLACARQVGATSAAAIAAAHLCGVQAEHLEPGEDTAPLLAIGSEAVALARQAGDDYVLAVAFNNLGVAYRAVGDNEQAAAHYEAGLEVRRRIGDVSRIALSLHNLAWVAYLAGDTNRAHELYSEAADLAAGIGDKRHICFANGGLAEVAFHDRRWEEAEARNRETLRLARELGSKAVVADALLRAAALAAAGGDAVRAARLAAASQGEPVPAYHEHLAIDAQREAIEQARSSVGTDVWERALAEGRALSLDEAVAYALSA